MQQRIEEENKMQHLLPHPPKNNTLPVFSPAIEEAIKQTVQMGYRLRDFIDTRGADDLWLRCALQVYEVEIGRMCYYIFYEGQEDVVGLCGYLSEAGSLFDASEVELPCDKGDFSDVNAHDYMLLMQKFKCVQSRAVELEGMIKSAAYPDWFLSLCAAAFDTFICEEFCFHFEHRQDVDDMYWLHRWLECFLPSEQDLSFDPSYVESYLRERPRNTFTVDL